MTDQTMAGVCTDQLAASLGAELVAVVDRIAALETSRLSGQGAAGLVGVLSEQTSRLSGLRLGALTTVTESGVWGLDASRSPAAWLVRVERCSKAAAGSDLKTARGLTDLPATHAAVLEGSVPLRHAEAMTRTCLRTPRLREALTDPVCGEEFLIAHAHLGLDAFRVLLNTWAVRADPDAADAAYRDDQARHQLLLADTTDGTDVTGKLSPLGGETVRAALLAQIGIPAKDDPRTHGQRLHDALIALAAAALDGGTLGRHASVRPQIVVHVDYPTYRGLLTPTDEGEAEQPLGGLVPAGLQESGQPLAPEEFRRIHCDSQVTRIVFGPQGEVLDVGRTQRTFTGPLRRALDARDRGCRAPNCSNPPRLCEGHHRVPWHQGGTTTITDGLLLCWSCHDWAHARGITITRTSDGGLRFTDRHGQHVGTTYPHHHPGSDGPIAQDGHWGRLLAFPGEGREPAQDQPTATDPWDDD